MKKICEYCHQEFETPDKRTKYCCRDCYNDAQKKRVLVHCEWCNKEIEKTISKAKRSKVHYCSRECRGKAETSKLQVKCSCCGKSFKIINHDLKRSKNHYCSRKCKDEHQKIKLLGTNNPNYKNRSQKLQCCNCGKEIEILTCIVEKRKHVYCSVDCKCEHQKIILIGSNNPNYKELKEEEVRIRERQYTGYKEWRKDVFERDKYKCVCCGTNTTRKNRLVAHHILNHYKYPELRIEVNNGITLCSQCHREFHKIYGTLDNNQQQLNEFLNTRKTS